MRKHIIANTILVAALAVVAAGCGAIATDPLAIPDSPDGTVQVVINGIAQHHPEVVWRALPPSYQADVEAVAANFAENMDPVIFERSVAVGRKAAMVLQSKKELILVTETVKNSGVDVETFDAAWEDSMQMVDIILASDLTRLEAYADLDVETLLTDTGARMIAHAAALPAGEDGTDTVTEQLAKLEATTVELVSEDGDEAVVRISHPDEEPVDVAMTRIEGRWLPSELVEKWPGAIEQANERIEFFASEEAAQMKVQILFAIGMAEGFIDQLDLMEAPEDLDNLIGGILGNFMQTTGSGSNAI